MVGTLKDYFKIFFSQYAEFLQSCIRHWLEIERLCESLPVLGEDRRALLVTEVFSSQHQLEPITCPVLAYQTLT